MLIAALSLNALLLVASGAMLCYFAYALLVKQRLDMAHISLGVAVLAVFLFSALYFLLRLQIERPAI